MTRIFLTGDRSLDPAASLVLAASTISQLGLEGAASGEPIELVTGDNKGFEQSIRSFCDALKIPYETYPTGVNPDTGKPAWDTRHEMVNLTCDQVIFLHVDPQSSSIGASLFRTVEEGKIVMPVFAL